jgi:ribose 5-phosphate isomerase B
MRIALAADHAGYELKQRLVRELERLGHEVVDFGAPSGESSDYPDYAIPAARSVAEGKADRAILVCGNGIGMGMTANRIPGVRAAVVYSDTTARATREHHDSNALCLGAREFPADALVEWTRIWLETPFAGGRHARRVAKFQALERKGS